MLGGHSLLAPRPRPGLPRVGATRSRTPILLSPPNTQIRAAFAVVFIKRLAALSGPDATVLANARGIDRAHDLRNRCADIDNHTDGDRSAALLLTGAVVMATGAVITLA